MRILLAKTTLAAALFAAVSSNAMADCATRHFYNNSDIPWTIAILHGTCDIDGVTFQHSCTVGPNSVANLHWPNNFFPGGDFLTISGNKYYRNTQFSVSTSSCKYYTPGDTGNVVLNEPANGDVFTCGKSYACKPK